MDEIRCLSRGQWWRGAKYPPRGWQADALSLAVDAILEGKKGLVRAVMGAGKSVLIAELLHVLTLPDDEIVVVSAPTRKLVDQLHQTLMEAVEQRLSWGFVPGIGVTPRVGRYYTAAKEVRSITVACNASLGSLAEELSAAGLKVGLWVVDEAHNSECETLHAFAHEVDPIRLIGFTATPYRAKKKERLQLFDTMVYSYGAREALSDGVVVPWRVVGWEGPPCSVDEACIHLIARAVRDGLGPGVVDAGGYSKALQQMIPGIADSEQFARQLHVAGLAADFVHSGLPKWLVDEKLEMLRRGDLQVIVHCAMLKEGVDLPWLRWLCLRRRVVSPVWFAQHVGRALRAYPGKDYATIFDPHDLFGSLGMSYPAVLGGGVDERSPFQLTLEELEEELEEMLDIIPRDPLGRPFPFHLAHGQAALIAPLEQRLRLLTVALDAAGRLQKDVIIKSTAWRKEPASEKQIALIGWKAKALARSKGVPEDVLQTLRWLYVNRGHMTRGAASDFVDVIDALAGHWPPEAGVMLDAG